LMRWRPNSARIAKRNRRVGHGSPDDAPVFGSSSWRCRPAR
jgi:hypothetical protein